MQNLVSFPDVELADETGLLAVGGDLSVEMLYSAYSSGIFPWPIENFVELPWFAPPQRGILFFDRLHIPRSLQKTVRAKQYSMKFNTAFAQVIRACADSHSAEQGTWITEEMIDGYIAFHEAGFAHSVECYLDQELVGGLYGVAIGKYFAGESMFYSQSNASKLCLLYLIEKLRSQGVTWMDCQQTTPLLLTFGAQNIPRTDFMKILKTALSSDPLVWN